MEDFSLNKSRKVSCDLHVEILKDKQIKQQNLTFCIHQLMIELSDDLLCYYLIVVFFVCVCVFEAYLS